ncbi:MAG: polysaccharide biosynthesis/export family protein [Rikenellaceae bacterium]
MVKRLLLLMVVVMATSCATQKKIAYLQDVQPNVEFEYAEANDIKIQPADMVSILVTSKNSELAAMFNKQVSGAMGGSTGGSSSELSGYIVNSKGYIDFPVLGEIHIAGMTKEAIAEYIKTTLVSKRLVNDPIVTVSFMNLQYHVLGEVSSPGKYDIDKNQTTIFEALSEAGDLTIYGQRDRVFLTRNVGDKKVTYQVDLRSHDIYKSPAFFVQQNDMIYVEPNNVRASQSTINGNTVKSATFWMSLASFLTTMVLLFAN